MTMYYISEFCRICMQYDKNLIDIVKIEREPHETLLTKLKLCVSEVEWTYNSILLCQSCIRKLNNCYEFKKQCIISAQTWKHYLELLNESQKKISAQVSVTLSRNDVSQELVDNYLEGEKRKDNKQNAFVRLMPNNNFLKLHIDPQNSLLLNFIPTNTLRFISLPQAKPAPAPKPPEDVNLTKILRESKTEELSVEIDPTDFGCMSEDSPVHTVEVQGKDWEELISGTKIHAAEIPRLVPIKSDPRANVQETETSVNGNKSGNIYNNYVPILPKPNLYQSNDITNEEKYEFFNGGHFLTPKINLAAANANFTCELCDKGFESLKMLRFHIKQFHLGKFPYKCDYCFSEFAARSIYDTHMLKHKNETDGFLVKESLTLQDFPSTPAAETKEKQWEQPQVQITICEAENGESSGEHRCDVCSSAFSTPNGLLRHKVRKHNQKTKKKYFIKGMKNARCDICNRDFSTQSYLQLHKKLHLKNGPSYKGKVFKNKNANYAKKVAEEKPEAMEVEEGKDEVEIKEVINEEIEIKEEILSEDEDVVMNEETPKKSSSPSLKIKINLKNLKKEASNGNDADEEFDVRLTSVNEAPFADQTNANGEAVNYFCCLETDSEKIDDASPIKCIYCTKTFQNKRLFKSHVSETHLKSKIYRCQLCSNTFSEASHLTKHLRVHYSSASCSICQKMFSTENEMKEHNDSHQYSAFWQCGICYTLFTNTKSLKEHMQGHEQKIAFECHFCDAVFTESRGLSRHVAEHDGKYRCTKCDESFEGETEKNSHDVKHGTHLCSVCLKTYRKKHEFTRHMNLHEKHPHLLEVNSDNGDGDGESENAEK